MGKFAGSVWHGAVFFVLFGVLSACGGGGGGGGSPANAGGLSIDPSSLAFTAEKNGPTPPSQVVKFTITAGDAAFVGADISSFPNWLSVQFGNTSPTSADMFVSIDSTNLPSGTYTHSFEVGIGRIDQSVIATRVVTVTYTVIGGISAIPSALTFAQVSGSAPTPAQALTLSDSDANSYAWDLAVSYQSGSGWLTLSALNGAALPASVSATVDPGLAPGNYNATITATGNGQTVDVPVTYTVRGANIMVGTGSVVFSAGNRQLALPTAATVAVTTENGSTVGYTIDVTYSAGASAWLTTGGSSAPGSLSLAIDTVDLPQGTYGATVKLTPTNGRPAVSVFVTYTVRATTIGRGPGLVNFSAISGESTVPTDRNIAVTTEANSSTPYATTVTYGPGETGWLNASSGTAPDTLTIRPNTTDIAPGTYSATVTLTPNSGAAAILIPVSYTLTAPTFNLGATSATFDIDAASTATSAFLDRSISTESTGAELTWLATSTVPWVTVTPSGTTGTALNLTLVVAELGSLENGTLSTTVTVNYSSPFGAVGTRTVTVSLNLKLPTIDYVAPYFAVPNISREVVLRGSGFDGAQGRPINFGSTPITTYTVLHDTAIRVNHPSLVAGSYLVQAQNDLGLSRTGAALRVGATPSYADTTLSYTNVGVKQVVGLIYDAERQALLVGLNYPGARSSNEILRYAYDGNTWETPTFTSVPNLRDIALTIEGQTLLAAGDTAMAQLDPVDLATTVTTDFNVFPTHIKQMAVANDGDVFVTSIHHSGFSGSTTSYRYNVNAATFTGLVSQFRVCLAGSADGSLIVTGESDISAARVAYYDTVTWSGHSTPIVADTTEAALDRNGTRSIFLLMLPNIAQIYNSAFAPVGALPGSTVSFLFSPTGAFVYTYDSAGTVRKFDADTATEIGTGTTVPSGPGTDVKMAITPDGSTLFLAGSDRVVVMQAP